MGRAGKNQAHQGTPKKVQPDSVGLKKRIANDDKMMWEMSRAKKDLNDRSLDTGFDHYLSSKRARTDSLNVMRKKKK